MNNRITSTLAASGIFLILTLISCHETNAPKPENIPETMTRVELRFKPTGTGSEHVAIASEPSKGGVSGMKVDEPIVLAANTEYTLEIEILNEHYKPTDPLYKVNTEILAEKNDHQFFFSWTEGLFSNPTGNGNEDNASDPVRYNDQDDHGLPVGLKTRWTTGASGQKGVFKVLLKHQPDVKTATSSIKDGETELEIEFGATIE